MLIDIKSLFNFSISFDNFLVSGFFLFLFISFFFILYFFGNFYGFTAPLIYSCPATNDFSDLYLENPLQVIGYLFVSDFLIIIVACFLLLICIIIIMIGFKESEN